MEKWTKWNPIDSISQRLDFISFLYDENGILIRLRDLASNSDFELRYESVFSFRNTDEGRRLKLLSVLTENYGDAFYKEWSIFKVESSEYIEWLNEETYGMYEHYETEHHVYITPNDILEILTAHVPTLS